MFNFPNIIILFSRLLEWLDDTMILGLIIIYFVINLSIQFILTIFFWYSYNTSHHIVKIFFTIFRKFLKSYYIFREQSVKLKLLIHKFVEQNRSLSVCFKKKLSTSENLYMLKKKVFQFHILFFQSLTQNILKHFEAWGQTIFFFSNFHRRPLQELFQPTSIKERYRIYLSLLMKFTGL